MLYHHILDKNIR